MSFMRRYVPLLLAAAVACGVPVVTAGSAAAFGAETFGCTINPGGGGIYAQYCGTSTPTTNYSVNFSVGNGSGSYTYAWTIPGSIKGLTGTSGCTSTSSTCTFGIASGGSDRIIDVSVVVSQAGQQETFYSEADVPAVCGGPGGGLVFC
jgi:hypothetical protein